jgi:hypothetical protein
MNDREDQDHGAMSGAWPGRATSGQGMARRGTARRGRAWLGRATSGLGWARRGMARHGRAGLPQG